MSVLVLHRGPLECSPYADWLADYDGDVILLVSREQLELCGEELPSGAGYRHVELVSGYDVCGYVEPRALELARAHGVRHVVACQERDLERAAQLREILELPGQRLDSALAFRDKVLMKELVRAAGVPVAPFAELECAADLIAFVQVVGLPVVVKPRNGAGSVQLTILRDDTDLDAWLGEDPEAQPNLIAEVFVPGSMCHVDGLVVGGRVAFAWPSRYLYALASYAEDPGARLDVTLDADDPLTRRLLDFTDSVLDALPGPRDFAFHAEVFHTPDDQLVLCEIACRTGGASVRDIQRTLFGADPTECQVRAQVGLPLALPDAGGRLRPRAMAGQMVLMKRPGTVLDAPTGEPPFSWVERYRLLVRPGQAMAAAANSADFLASFVVSAPDRVATESRLRELEAWFGSSLVLAEPGSA